MLPKQGKRVNSFMKRKRVHKYINGTKGVISIFLALLMVPFTIVAGALIETGRIYSSVAIFDEALCNASNSTLGTYDEFLKKRFGLLAIKQSNKGNVSQEDVQEFINGVFQDYMKINCGALPGTFVKESISTAADGVYPLADYSVLKNQILEYSKYQIPAKFISDNINLENFFKDLEKCLPGYALFDKITRGFNTANTLVSAGQAVNRLINASKTQDAAKENYENAYSLFEDAYNDYLEKKAEVEQLTVEADNAYGEWQTALEQSERLSHELEEINSSIEQLSMQMNSIPAESDAKEPNQESYIQDTGNIASQISSLEEQRSSLNSQISDLKISEKEAAYNTASENLDAKKEELSTLKAEVLAARDSYSSTISKLKTTMGDVNSSRKDVMKELNNAFDIGTDALIESASENRKQNINVAKGLVANKNAELDELNKSYGEATSNAERNHIRKAYEKTEEYKNAYNNRRIELEREQSLVEAEKNTFQGIYRDLDNFQKISDDELYGQISDNLSTLNSNVTSFNCENPNPPWQGDNYHLDLSDLLTEQEVKEFQQAVVKKIIEDSSTKILTKIAEFWKALASLGYPYDPLLNAKIDENYYSSMGGLPSSRNKSDFQSEYAADDKALSERYKNEMTSYSDAEAGYSGSLVDDIDNLIESIETLFVSMSELKFKMDWNLLKVAEKIMAIVENAIAVVNNIAAVVRNLSVESLFDVIKGRTLVSGYLYYNIPNRITYSKSEFSESGLAPLVDLDRTGRERSFKGAELEYILFRTLDETENQKKAFWSIFTIRLLFDIVPVVTCSTVQSIANSLMEVPYVGPFLGILTYVVFIILEPYIDSLILCGGGKISLIKHDIYLSPDGITDLIDDVANIELKSSEKEMVEEKSNRVQTFIKEAENNPSGKSGLIESSKSASTNGNKASTKDNKPSLKEEDDKTFKIDYQLMLLLISMVKSERFILSGIADIVQMEASQKASIDDASKSCRLEYAYTYLRASGQFSENMFMPIAQQSRLTSQKRVIYQGY